ncbi:MAG: GNAT family N-acetyltransferase [Candidatus Hydrogenedentes bacterium]|nr:GNAT family N-acetyltransferase [Candidatus Hydrogenedentota bacterium]
MYRATLSDIMLSGPERMVFSGDLRANGLDEAVWEVFAAFMGASSKATKPTVLRVYDGDRLVGAAFVSRCRGYGRALFGSPALHRPIDLVGLPSYIWLRVGYCAEVAANPGFVAEGACRDEVVSAMIAHLRRHSFGVMITDRAGNERLHGGAAAFPYVSDGIVDVAGMGSVGDYVGGHRNIKRKIKEFTNKGGEIDVIRGRLDEGLTDTVRQCIEATAARSVIHSPFQDTFPEAAAATCRCPSDRMVHFVATMGGAVLGYHSFVESGDGLRMLHGAFDRTRRTTHHCYENLIIATVDWALRQGLKAVYFGPILNETKRRMMNRAERSALFFHSDQWWMRAVFPLAFRCSRMQNKALLAFADVR